ncbi:MAG: conjugative transposon protein TraN [Alistipes inops]
MKRYIVFLLCLCAGRSGQAQIPQSEITPRQVEVSFNKTTHLIFPAPVQYVDLGSTDIIADKAAGAANVVRLKAAVRDFQAETNLTVITADGRFYAFDVRYADDPGQLSIRIMNDLQAQIPEGKAPTVPVRLDALDGDDAARIDSAMEQIYNNDKPQIKHIGYKRYGLQTLLTGIYIDSEGWLYFGIEMRNDSRIPFDIDHIRMYVRDKRLPRRTAVQDIEIIPVRRLHPLSEIDTGKTGRTVWAIPKMTIPDGKALHIDIYERGGGRHQSLRVENRDILAAKPIPESR